jgi:NAD(P)-dependent dehydrogenase (short-subunit alcohol dehydrogenase family)
MIGAIYTFKLGQHYLRAQPEGEGRDRCFIFKGSVAGLLDQPGSFQYSAAKFGLRGLMRSARRTSWQEGIRVAYVAPW